MTNVILDFDPEKKKELISVNEKLVASLKPHQVSVPCHALFKPGFVRRTTGEWLACLPRNPWVAGSSLAEAISLSCS